MVSILILSDKGGAGKSKLAVLLHEAYRASGRSVAIRDWDAQGTSTRTLKLIGGQLAQMGATYDVLIFDTKGNDLNHIATTAALREADIILIPTSPSLEDIWGAEPTVQFAKARKKKTAVIRLVFTKVRKGTVLAREIHNTTKEVGAKPLETMLGDREHYRHLTFRGWKALNEHERQEVLQLARKVRALK